ncbi:tryptophanyl-tRNA synthetase [Pedobacter steynii]|uniref:Tryptophan--tRNA ligase n=1 Tax=Pedobacter steynii TaxID=430522 RepID=A0A1G9PRH0_9SPHI|nr:tryptophan--tRNA ligase [Pedobacter steynii]NQX38903.1 tryptophan--tRNA ligase [Pedobacter steynii]SDM01360.1 tryptophanyl-tRNA synthetase [Pedobacter steynii]
MKETVVSGIRPTGNLHLGNYFGAVKNFVKMQYDFNCFFFIADLHSLTTHPTPGDLHGYVKHVLVEYLACGIDPEETTIYIQSDVPEVTELYLYLNMNAYMGELERSASFKDKVRTQPDNVNAGLLTYPTLMAADILIHKAVKVPVGKDQEQHLEMTRTFGNRFNRLYNHEMFPEVQAFNFDESLVKVPGLDGKGKMSKSSGDGSCIYLADSPEIIRKKVSRAVTDGGPTEDNQPKPEAIQNLFDLMKIVSPADTMKHFDELYNTRAIRYGDFKKQLAEDMIVFNTPIREKIEEISKDTSYLRQVAKHGALKARESAQKTIKEARELIGFKSF